MLVSYIVWIWELRQRVSCWKKIWKEDNQYLSPFYRTNLRQLYLDVHYWTDYLCDKPVIDKEFPAVQKDFRSFGKDVEEAAFITDYFDIDLFLR